MRLAAMEVVGANRERIVVEPGDPWPLPYRGSKYSVVPLEGGHIVVWGRYGQRVPAERVPPGLVDAVRHVKKSNGSFRITAHGAVITKTEASGWSPFFVGLYEGGLSFPGLNDNPNGLERGKYWTGFPFQSGEEWSVSPAARSSSHLSWSRLSRRFRSIGRYPEILETCLSIRPRGGLLYITEHGHIWMNVPDGGLAPRYKREFRELQMEQVADFKASNNAVLLRLLVKRLEATKMRPVYVGRISDFDDGKAPWTLFGVEHEDDFGGVGRSAADDRMRVR